MNFIEMLAVGLGILSMLIFVAMAACNDLWANPRQRGDDAGPMLRSHDKMVRHRRPRRLVPRH